MQQLYAQTQRAAQDAVTRLLALRDTAGCWTGELAPSALATSAAVCALALLDRESGVSDSRAAGLARAGLDWLARTANDDGGWGDTPLSFSSMGATALAWAAFGLVPGADQSFASVVQAAEKWLATNAGGVDGARLAGAIGPRYGTDQTFAAPILTACALAGRLDPPDRAWRLVPQLPFERAARPPQSLARFRLPVASYALPALIAVGQLRHQAHPTWNPITGRARRLAQEPTMALLDRMQPSSGGFADAVPLTAFVTMSLVGCGWAAHPAAQRGAEFLSGTARPDGSWAVGSNLATRVTTLSVNALAGSGGPDAVAVWLDSEARARLVSWLLGQQHQVEHPLTHAAPGGWAWTDLPGGVPDAGDTAGALLALRNLGDPDDAVRQAATRGVEWLLAVQNADGGIPTFCRGWTHVPSDRSGPDLTAHAVRAWIAWRDEMPAPLESKLEQATNRALSYLGQTMREDGTWASLWFGNAWAPAGENPVCGTARVLEAMRDALLAGYSQAGLRLREATRALVKRQLEEGGWSGGASGGPATIEETALAIEALATVASTPDTRPFLRDPRAALETGLQWLMKQCMSGEALPASPIGLCHAGLAYSERLYPVIFAAGALLEARRALARYVNVETQARQ